MADRDVFDHKASAIVEDHIRTYNLTVVPHPDPLKAAIAAELRLTWNDAIEAAKNRVSTMLRTH